MTLSFNELIERFKTHFEQNGSSFVFKIIQEFCNSNNLIGPDGLRGLLDFVEVSIRRDNLENISAEFKSLSEIAFAIWAFDQLNRSDIPNTIAPQFRTGWDFGETRGYRNVEANYFRNFELELHVGLRLLEANLEIVAGRQSEPDYIISTPPLVVEVKAPASKKALFQGIIKATKQIENSGTKGIIILSLDHMVKRGCIDYKNNELPADLINIILSALPRENTFVLGVITEWVNWEQQFPSAIVQAFMLNELHNLQDEDLLRLVWQSFSNENIEELILNINTGTHPFPYENFAIETLDPSTDGGNFFELHWAREDD